MTADKITRRSALAAIAGTAGAWLAASSGADPGSVSPLTVPVKAGLLKHSVCRWCYGKMELDELCRNAAAMGIHSVELLGEPEWPIVKKYGLTCAMPNGPSGIVDGWNRPQDHDRLVKRSEELLPKIKEAGFSNAIVFSGNLRGLTPQESLANCAAGIKRITKLAEELGITLHLELLNSKRDHKDYAGDNTKWGFELVKRVESDRFKILYDIYHMQIMEGDVIATIQENISMIGHFHTGGVPGRHEIDETQELNYRRIAQAIADTGYRGFVAQEFIPKLDPMASLRQGIEIFSV